MYKKHPQARHQQTEGQFHPAYHVVCQVSNLQSQFNNSIYSGIYVKSIPRLLRGVRKS